MFISHDMPQLLRVADRLVVLRLGSKVYDGPTRDVDATRPRGDDDRRDAAGRRPPSRLSDANARITFSVIRETLLS